MSVLELLELQARARAIRSQLALETQRKAKLKEANKVEMEDSDNEDAVIIESPKNIEIVITSSESETEDSRKVESKENNEDKGSKEDTQSNKELEDIPVSAIPLPDPESSTSQIQAKEVESEVNHELKDVANKTTKESDLPDKIQIKSNIVIHTKEDIPVEKENKDCSEINTLSYKVTEESTDSLLTNEVYDDDAKINSTTNSNQSIEKPETRKVAKKTFKKKHRIIRNRKLSLSKESDGEVNKDASSVKMKEDDLVKEIANSTNSENVTDEECQKEKDISVKDKTPDDNNRIHENDDEHTKNNSDENDGIVINVDQSEIECITSD